MADDERSALLDRIEGDLAGVEQALGRLDAGTYFVCEICGSPLADDLLVSAPMASRCAACAGGASEPPMAADVAAPANPGLAAAAADETAAEPTAPVATSPEPTAVEPTGFEPTGFEPTGHVSFAAEPADGSSGDDGFAPEPVVDPPAYPAG